MPILLTHRDRLARGLRIEINRIERALIDDKDDHRAVAFHRARLDELRRELEKLED